MVCDHTKHSVPWTGTGRAPAEVKKAERHLGRATGGTNTAQGGHRVGRALEGPRQQCQWGGVHNVFPRWLLREVEFRQLAHAEPAALKQRRERAASWIKQEVRCVQKGRRSRSTPVRRGTASLVDVRPFERPEFVVTLNRLNIILAESQMRECRRSWRALQIHIFVMV